MRCYWTEEHGNHGYCLGVQCEDCGKELTESDFQGYICGNNVPIGEVPRCCVGCAEKALVEGGGRGELV